MTRKLQALEKAVYAAHKALNNAFLQEFPVGARVEWLYRDAYRQTGTIEHNNAFGNHLPEMRVLNDHTGKLVWVKLWMKPRRIS